MSAVHSEGASSAAPSSSSVAPADAAGWAGEPAAPAVDKGHSDPLTVWDLPLRLFHAGLLASVGTALLTGWIGGNAMVWHGRAGAVVAGLLGFRLVWGFVGSPTSRFRQFLPTPARLLAYLRGRWHGVGHNPLGGLAVLALLGVLAAQVSTGLFSDDEIAFTGPYASSVEASWSLQLTAWHHRLAWAVYGLLGLHATAIAVHEGLKRHRLVGPMFRLGKGRRPEPVTGTTPRPGRQRTGLVLALAFGLACLGTGWGAFRAEKPGPLAAPAASTARPQAW